MNIPFVNLKKQYDSIRKEIDKTVLSVIEQTAFIQGKYVREFEKDFACSFGGEHAIGCSSGTSAIFLSLKALGIGVGDEVITTTHSFFATVEAIVETGAHPVLVDIDPDTYNINTKLIERVLSGKTKAVIPVHIFGNPVQMDRIMEIADENGLCVIEDCAQAHLATFKGKNVGTFGNTGCFSFYPGKNLGAYGDAGAVICNDEHLAKEVRCLSDHGRAEKYIHEKFGYNFRIDGIQAAVLSVKLKYLEYWTQERRKKALKYKELLQNVHEIKLPVEQMGGKHVYHLFVIQVDNRDEVLEQLKKKEIQAGIHYPVPLHLQPALKPFGYRHGDFPVAEKASGRFLSLPIYPELEDSEQEYICYELKKAVKA